MGRAPPWPGRREPADSPRHPDPEDMAQPIAGLSPAVIVGAPATHREPPAGAC